MARGEKANRYIQRLPTIVGLPDENTMVRVKADGSPSVVARMRLQVLLRCRVTHSRGEDRVPTYSVYRACQAGFSPPRSDVSADSDRGAIGHGTDAPGTEATGRESIWQLMRGSQRWGFRHVPLAVAAQGALVVPIVITEPAVGNGGGAAIAFFKAVRQSRGVEGARRTHPLTSMGSVPRRLRTAPTARRWPAIHSATTGGVIRVLSARPPPNLDFYTKACSWGRAKIGYNLDGVFSFQQVSRRLGMPI